MSVTVAATKDELERERSTRSGLIVLVLALCGTSVSLMQTLVVPLLPDFPELLGTTSDNASWLVTVTLLTSAVATPILSRLADMHGKRRMVVVSLVVLLAGSLLGAVSDSLAGLIAARALQGFAPALIPIGISMMRDELPPERIGGAVALMSATLGIGGAVGLPLSGVIYDAFGWQAVFWGSVVMAAVMLVLVLAVVPESGVRTPGRFDWPGAILMSLALTSLLLGISKGGTWGWTSQWTLLSFTLSFLLFALWAPWELRTGEPLVDLRTSTRRPVLLTNIASLLAGFAMFANLLVATQQLQIPVETGVGFGLDVTQAGLAMLPGGVLMVLMAPVSASITRRFGARITLVAGLVITGFGYVVRVLLDATLAQLVLRLVQLSQPLVGRDGRADPVPLDERDADVVAGGEELRGHLGDPLQGVRRIDLGVEVAHGVGQLTFEDVVDGTPTWGWGGDLHRPTAGPAAQQTPSGRVRELAHQLVEGEARRRCHDLAGVSRKPGVQRSRARLSGDREVDGARRAALLGAGTTHAGDAERDVGAQQRAYAVRHLLRAHGGHHGTAGDAQHLELHLLVVGDDRAAVPLARGLAATEEGRDPPGGQRLRDRDPQAAGRRQPGDAVGPLLVCRLVFTGHLPPPGSGHAGAVGTPCVPRPPDPHAHAWKGPSGALAGHAIRTQHDGPRRSPVS
ncbi:hypothetical protein Pve01_84590 [Planomonospora venezuelensis]|nr:hypothetical protein Pve01_84590 [Planomonospora venezuelensis]